MPGRRRDHRIFYVILAMTLLYLVVVQGYPFLWSLSVSMTNQRIGGRGAFTGLGNYLRELADSRFQAVLRFTFLFVFVTVAAKLSLGTVMALTLNQPFRLRALWRALLFLPWALPTLTSVLTWRWMLGDVGGIINYALQRVGLIQRPVAWLGQPVLAQLSVMAVNVWRGVPFFGISILAAIQAIPAELYEASFIDGAGSWRRFRSITIPAVSGVVALVSLISTIWTFGDFAIIWLMTRGGPAASTHVLSTLSYVTAFQNLEIARGIAISLFIVPVSLVLMVLTTRMIYRGVR